MIVTGIESLGDGRVFVKVSDPLPRIAQGWQLVCGASVWVVEAVDGCRGMRPRIVTGLLGVSPLQVDRDRAARAC